jgi:hypothetical protein
MPDTLPESAESMTVLLSAVGLAGVEEDIEGSERTSFAGRNVKFGYSGSRGNKNPREISGAGERACGSAPSFGERGVLTP